MATQVMETGCCSRASGVELKCFLTSGGLMELALGPFGPQHNRLVI